jgi:hypothetical protein
MENVISAAASPVCGVLICVSYIEMSYSGLMYNECLYF